MTSRGWGQRPTEIGSCRTSMGRGQRLAAVDSSIADAVNRVNEHANGTSPTN